MDQGLSTCQALCGHLPTPRKPAAGFSFLTPTLGIVYSILQINREEKFPVSPAVVGFLALPQAGGAGSIPEATPALPQGPAYPGPMSTGGSWPAPLLAFQRGTEE